MHKHLRSTLVLSPAKWCPGRDLNPHSPCGEKDFKSVLKTASGTPFLCFQPFPSPQARRTDHENRWRHAEKLRSLLGVFPSALPPDFDRPLLNFHQPQHGSPAPPHSWCSDFWYPSLPTSDQLGTLFAVKGVDSNFICFAVSKKETLIPFEWLTAYDPVFVERGMA